MRHYVFALTCASNQLFAVKCTNTTKNLIAVRISADACYVQQYLLRPVGMEGDTLTCHGIESHSMMFHLVSGKAICLSPRSAIRSQADDP